jgi:aminoglycoside/choline kinase family phosphotransferase
MSRDQLVTDWVASRFPNQSVEITPASADASFRRYFRLTWPEGGTRILMDAPPDKEDCKPFIHVAGLLAEAGLAAPRILDQDLANGFLVLTDLGRVGYLAFQFRRLLQSVAVYRKIYPRRPCGINEVPPLPIVVKFAGQ